MARSEFKKHDIIVEIGRTVKYVVKDVFDYVYRIEPLDKIGRISIPIGKDEDFIKVGEFSCRLGEKDEVAKNYVKVGTWDFDRKEEVEDEG